MQSLDNEQRPELSEHHPSFALAVGGEVGLAVVWHQGQRCMINRNRLAYCIDFKHFQSKVQLGLTAPVGEDVGYKHMV